VTTVKPRGAAGCLHRVVRYPSRVLSIRNGKVRAVLSAALFTCLASTHAAGSSSTLHLWRSTLDRSESLHELKTVRWGEGVDNPPPMSRWVQVDETQRFQVMEGMGASLEGTTCYNLSALSPRDRHEALVSLLDPKRGIGMNLMRLCIGTSDFTGDPWYSYDDLPPGQTDPTLAHFSIGKDRAYILPVIQEARRVNPKVVFFASPWSPPAWMKSGGDLTGGRLLPEWRAAYAEYFARFIEAYAKEGVPIHAVTVQNEPGVDRAQRKDPRWHYPSCGWSGADERDFIRDFLGPALRRHNLKTRIWTYDHNYNERPVDECEGLNHPRTVLKDARAAVYVDGVAFHGYDGRPSGMSVFHREFPQVPIHFTEGSVFGVSGAVDLVERFRNWACSYNAWVIVLDNHGKPNNGPFAATRAILALDAERKTISREFEYDMSGQFMKFIEPGAVRVASTQGDAKFDNVAMVNPDGSAVLVLVNAEKYPAPAGVRWRDKAVVLNLPAASITTVKWPTK
jgi:glucosylceramidase